MAKNRGGTNLYLRSSKKKKRSFKPKISVNLRRSKGNKGGDNRFPLPNMAFKDIPPLLVGVIGSMESFRDCRFEKMGDVCNSSEFGDDPAPHVINIGFKRVMIRHIGNCITTIIDFAKVSDIIIFIDEIDDLMVKLLHLHNPCRIVRFLSRGNVTHQGRGNKNLTKGEDVVNDLESLKRLLKSFKVNPVEFRMNNFHILVDYVIGNNVYGFVRGGTIDGDYVHVSGVGDYKISKIISYKLPDRDGLLKIIDASPSDGWAPEEMCSDTLSTTSKSEASEGTATDSGCSISIDEKFSSVNVVVDGEDNLIKRKIFEKYKLSKLEGRSEFEVMRERCRRREREDIENDKMIPGTYVTLELEPIGGNGDTKLLADAFNESGYLLLGKFDLNYGTNRFGFLPQKNVMTKSGEYVIVSFGWHRFITVATFYDEGLRRNRYLKKCLKGYSNAIFRGPIYRNVRYCMLKATTRCVAGIGSISHGSEESAIEVSKKCKLIGTPAKVFRNNVFVKNMFNSKSEAMMFVGAKIKTVGSLRGIVKRPIGNRGLFRATFEGNVSMADIIFLKCYVKMSTPNYYKILACENDVPKLEMKENDMPDKYVAPKATRIEDQIQKRYILPKSIEVRLPIEKRKLIIDELDEEIIPPDSADFEELKDKVASIRERELNQLAAELSARKMEEEDARKNKLKGIVKSAVAKAVAGGRRRK